MKKQKGKKKIICIAGATASGKSTLALKTAEKNNGEIISVDSRQIYKNIPIFSGISNEEKKNHLVCFLNEWETFSAGDFIKLAEEKIKEIWQKNKVPVLVGGTSFYFKSLLYENFLPKVSIDKKFRKKMKGKSAEELTKILAKKDPNRAKNIDRNNIPRIIRSIEIVNSIGKFPEKKDRLRSDWQIEFFWIHLDKEEQKKNIEKNFRSRFGRGLIEEAFQLKLILKKHFLKHWYQKIFYFFFKKKLEEKIKKTFFDIGLAYKNIFRFWDGEIDEKEFIELGILEEQKYAKRQNTYLKKFFEELPEQENLKKEKIRKKLK